MTAANFSLQVVSEPRRFDPLLGREVAELRARAEWSDGRVLIGWTGGQRAMTDEWYKDPKRNPLLAPHIIDRLAAVAAEHEVRWGRGVSQPVIGESKIEGTWPDGHTATATYDGNGEWRCDRFGELIEFETPWLTDAESAEKPMWWVPPAERVEESLRRGFWTGCVSVRLLGPEPKAGA